MIEPIDKWLTKVLFVLNDVTESREWCKYDDEEKIK